MVLPHDVGIKERSPFRGTSRAAIRASIRSLLWDACDPRIRVAEKTYEDTCIAIQMRNHSPAFPSAHRSGEVWIRDIRAQHTSNLRLLVADTHSDKRQFRTERPDNQLVGFRPLVQGSRRPTNYLRRRDSEHSDRPLGGKILLTADEDQAIGILRMLNCGSFQATVVIESQGFATVDAVNLLYSVFNQTRDQPERHSSRQSALYVIDLEKYKELKRIKFGEGLMLETATTTPDGKTVYLACSTNNSVYVIDGTSDNYTRFPMWDFHPGQLRSSVVIATAIND